MVMVIILLLCLAAIPQFFALQHKNREKKMEKTIAVVQAGIAEWHFRKLKENLDAYPPILDANPANSRCGICFGEVMDKPLQNDLWFKKSDTEYSFFRNGNGEKPEDYREKHDFRITYDPALGSFTATQIQ